MILLRILIFSFISLLGFNLSAHAVPANDLGRFMSALKFDDTIAILSEEGMQSGTELGRDMLGLTSTIGWERTLSEIYDTDRMRRKIENGLAKGFEDLDQNPILDFYESDTGVEILKLENAARRSMMDSDTEEAAIDHYNTILDDQPPRLQQIETLIDDSDLIERNVAGALTANLMFYRGLADGGVLEVSEDEMLKDVWSEETEIRKELSGWLYAYFLMAYDPLSDQTLDDYAAFYRSPAGKQLNQLLFDAFDSLYEETSYLLGRAIADYEAGSEL